MNASQTGSAIFGENFLGQQIGDLDTSEIRITFYRPRAKGQV
jgi:hypothetical protein